MKRLPFLTAILLAAVFSCTNERAARQVLSEQGYTDIEIDGYGLTHCGKSDDTCTDFKATAPNGARVKGSVGCGHQLGGCGKGCTVRFR